MLRAPKSQLETGSGSTLSIETDAGAASSRVGVSRLVTRLRSLRERPGREAAVPRERDEGEHRDDARRRCRRFAAARSGEQRSVSCRARQASTAGASTSWKIS